MFYRERCACEFIYFIGWHLNVWFERTILFFDTFKCFDFWAPECDISDCFLFKKGFEFKGTDRQCKVVKLSMQCCGQILQDSFESLKTINNNTKLNLFHCYNKHFIITIIEKIFGHTFDVRKHAAVRLYKFYVLIYCTRICF